MTDFRALCAEILGTLDDYENDLRVDWDDWRTRARTALSKEESDRDDATLISIRKTTPRYRMSIIISTNDSAIDTRMHVIWSALDPNKEILESVSLPEKLSTFKL